MLAGSEETVKRLICDVQHFDVKHKLKLKEETGFIPKHPNHITHRSNSGNVSSELSKEAQVKIAEAPNNCP
jgi:hypothetical protein